MKCYKLFSDDIDGYCDSNESRNTNHQGEEDASQSSKNVSSQYVADEINLLLVVLLAMSQAQTQTQGVEALMSLQVNRNYFFTNLVPLPQLLTFHANLGCISFECSGYVSNFHPSHRSGIYSS